MVSNTIQCGFESHRGHHSCFTRPPECISPASLGRPGKGLPGNGAGRESPPSRIVAEHDCLTAAPGAEYAAGNGAPPGRRRTVPRPPARSAPGWRPSAEPATGAVAHRHMRFPLFGKRPRGAVPGDGARRGERAATGTGPDASAPITLDEPGRALFPGPTDRPGRSAATDCDRAHPRSGPRAIHSGAGRSGRFTRIRVTDLLTDGRTSSAGAKTRSGDPAWPGRRPVVTAS
jgi:hypothetical protein